jgi:hypothetical protein
MSKHYSDSEIYEHIKQSAERMRQLSEKQWPVPGSEICNECGGSGELDARSPNDPRGPLIVDCDVCNGTGERRDT